MEIYLVRHGETGGNVAKRHQLDSTRLTDLGKEQIIATTEEIKTLHPTHLVASPVVRAIESAQMIGEAINIIPETNPLFAELERPKFLHGHFHKSLFSIWFYARWYFGLTNHVTEGGETYAMLRERVKNAQAALTQYPHDARIVVVSHSVFINFFVAHLCRTKPLTPLAALSYFFKVLTIKNGSITKLSFDASRKETCQWRVEEHA